ncbi:MAG: phosphotransferase family protein [Rhodospirillaceae bacterium]
MSGLTQDQTGRVAAWLTGQAGGPVTVVETVKLSGGAIQENHRLVIDVAGGDWHGRHDLVLRRDAASAVETSHGRAEEFALLKAAHRAGAIVPTPCVLCEDPSVLGGPFFLMHRAAGEARGGRLVRNAPDAGLVRALGANMAKIHTIRPPVAGLDFLGAPPADSAQAAIQAYRDYLDALPDPHPAVEWGLAWLDLHAPAPGGVVLCHRDYRTGNLMIDDGRLTATLDWEFAAWSDPMEDIGWFLAKCWRFGRWDEAAGGLGPRDAFLDGYEAAAGRMIDRAQVPYWEVMAHVRWAVIALQQAHRHNSGEEPSIELALTAHVAPELEIEILAMTGSMTGEDAGAAR